MPRDHLPDRGTVAAISRETLRRTPHTGGVSWRITSTRTALTDPDSTVKMQRIPDLYVHPPDDGRMICVDEFGPLNPMPREGKVWQSVGSPRRPSPGYRAETRPPPGACRPRPLLLNRQVNLRM